MLYAPGLTKLDDIATLVKSVDRPVNVLLSMKGVNLTVADMSAVGVRRISVGGSLARCAFGALMRAAREMREQGTFTFAEDAMPFADLNSIFSH